MLEDGCYWFVEMILVGIVFLRDLGEGGVGAGQSEGLQVLLGKFELVVNIIHALSAQTSD